MATPPSYYRLPWVRAAGLILFACLLYANTLGHDYALDDAIVITDNTVVQRGAAGIGDLFTHDTFYGFFGEQDREALVAGGRYRPLTPALFALEREVADGPWLHHLLNVCWYAVLTVVVWLLLRRLGFSATTALLLAALFAAHPLHTEAVANIKGRDEIVALLACLLATYWLYGGATRGGVVPLAFGAVALFIGCLAKENAITFVAVVPVLLYVGEKRLLPGLVAVTVAAGAFLLLRTLVIGLSLGDPPTELMNNPFLRYTSEGVPVALGFFERLPTVLHTLLLYLKLCVWPTGLVHDYYPGAIELKGWGSPTVMVSLLLHAGLLGWSATQLRGRYRWVAAGVLVYLLTLSIVSNLFFSVGTFMSERFAFMPSFGLVLALAGATRLATGYRRRVQYGLVAVIAIFSVLTVVRNPVWKDNYTLFLADLPRQPDSAKLRNAAAGVRLDRYQDLDEAARVGREELLLDARRDLDRALTIHPGYRNAYLLRGNAQLLLGAYDEAIADYESAISLGDTDGTITGNLVIALQRAGRAAGEERQDVTAAIGYLERADALRPGDYETLRLLGVASGVSGRIDRALDYLERALALQPDNAGALRNYATALQRAGRTAEARAYLDRAEATGLR